MQPEYPLHETIFRITSKKKPKTLSDTSEHTPGSFYWKGSSHLHTQGVEIMHSVKRRSWREITKKLHARNPGTEALPNNCQVRTHYQKYFNDLYLVMNYLRKKQLPGADLSEAQEKYLMRKLKVYLKTRIELLRYSGGVFSQPFIPASMSAWSTPSDVIADSFRNSKLLD